MACAAALKTEGADGACGAALAGIDPHDNCAVDQDYPSSCLSDGNCNGKGACRKYAPEKTVCGTSTCSGGQETSYACNASGSCQSLGTQCFPFVCGASGGCLKSCSTAQDCVSGYTCKQSDCVAPGGATCDGDHTMIGANGDTEDCAPYKCSTANVCLTACSSRADCTSNMSCTPDGRCQPEEQDAGTDKGGCGCRAAGRTRSAGWMGLLFLMAVGSTRRRTGGGRQALARRQFL
jgi:hypothetical protein